MADSKIITLATLKGGSGKSTVASCLAVYWHLQNVSTVLIDADPQQSIHGRLKVDGLTVLSDFSDNIAETITEAAKSYDRVIVDTAGFKNRTSIAALAAADIALVPVKPSPMDVAVAAQTLLLVAEINSTNERQSNPIKARLVLTMTTAGTVIARHIREEIKAAGFKLLDGELSNRVGYAESALSSTTPTVYEPAGAAAHDIDLIAREIESLG
jgi:chromosome partitioning protein